MEPKMQDCLTLERMDFTDKSTVGELRLDGEMVCYTLEDTCRSNGIKITGKTAIPSGRYELVVTYSDRFKKHMPLLLNVDGFDGVRIHSGNTSEDTEGCILLGMRRGVDVIYDSRKAFDLVFPEIQKRVATGKLYLSIVGGRTTREALS